MYKTNSKFNTEEEIDFTRACVHQ